MGRAGGGSGGSFGGGSFGGGHSFGGSRAGGHTFGGSSRAGRSSSSSHSSYSSSSSHRSSSYSSRHTSNNNVFINNSRSYGSGGYYGGFGGGFGPTSYSSRRDDSSVIVTIITIIAIVFIMMFVSKIFADSVGDAGIPKSTIYREKIVGTSYNPNAVVIADDLDYIDSDSDLARQLKEFYEDTGVQPYIYIKGYDSDLATNNQKIEWAQNYYDNNIADTNGFMFIYFGSADDVNYNIPDSEKEIGYMSYVVGGAAGSVMDNEACEIFWSYIDRYWTSDLSTEDMFGTVFSKTANSIMKVDKTDKQTGMTMVIVLAGLGIGIVAVVLITKKFKRDREKAKETADILNADISKFSDDVSNDSDINKYL